jgi:hypothetical protein
MPEGAEVSEGEPTEYVKQNIAERTKIEIVRI